MREECCNQYEGPHNYKTVTKHKIAYTTDDSDETLSMVGSLEDFEEMMHEKYKAVNAEGTT